MQRLNTENPPEFATALPPVVTHRGFARLLTDGRLYFSDGVSWRPVNGLDTLNGVGITDQSVDLISNDGSIQITPNASTGQINVQANAGAIAVAGVSSIEALTGAVDVEPLNAITVATQPGLALGNKLQIGENHSARTDNPHGTTAAQTSFTPLPEIPATVTSGTNTQAVVKDVYTFLRAQQTDYVNKAVVFGKADGTKDSDVAAFTFDKATKTLALGGGLLVGAGVFAGTPPANGLLVQGDTICNSNFALNNNASTTAFNNSFSLFRNGSGSNYGIDLGYNSGVYNTRLFAPVSSDIVFATFSGSANPTLQSEFTPRVKVAANGGLAVGFTVAASTTPPPANGLKVQSSAIFNAGVTLENSASNTAVNPAFSVFSSLNYGLDLGHSNSSYNTRLFCPTTSNIVFAAFTGGSFPALQSEFTPRVTITGSSGNMMIGSGLAVNKLDVSGAMVIGASLAGSIVAPANGLHVQGQSRFGSPNPYLEFFSVCQNVGTTVPENTFRIHTNSITGAAGDGTSCLICSYSNGVTSRSVSLGVGNATKYSHPDNGFLRIGSATVISNSNGSWKFSDTADSGQVPVFFGSINDKGYQFYNTTADNQNAFTFYSASAEQTGATLRVQSARTTINNTYKLISAIGGSNAEFVVTDGGFVGVGISAPTACLDVFGATAAVASLRIRVQTATPTTPNDGDLWYNATNLLRRGPTVTRSILEARTADIATEASAQARTVSVVIDGVTVKLLAAA